MSVIYVALLTALALAAVAVIAFVIQVRSGQYDDLETPPRRILFDDVERIGSAGNKTRPDSKTRSSK